MTAEVIPLAQLTLDEHADKIRALGKRVIADVIEIGQRLIECKHICGHGNWLPWLTREFGWAETTAQRFMRVYELSKSKSGKLPDLSSRRAPASVDVRRALDAERAKELIEMLKKQIPPKPEKKPKAQRAATQPPMAQAEYETWLTNLEQLEKKR